MKIELEHINSNLVKTLNFRLKSNTQYAENNNIFFHISNNYIN